MPDVKPTKFDAAGDHGNFQTGDTVGVANGGTGGTTAALARTSLGLQIGSDIVAWDADLDAIAALATTGIPVRTSANTWQLRSIATASSARITVTNGDGVSGNPTLDLATVSDGGGGTFLKFTRDTYGRVSGTSAVVTGDLTSLLNSTYAPINNATFTGTTTLAADPTSALHAATKQYVDLISSGYTAKVSVRVATTANIANTATGAPNIVDGVTLAANDLVLVKNQSTGSQNGIYKVTTVGTGANGVWARDPNFDTSAEMVPGLFVFVSEGSTQDNDGFTLTTNAPITLGTTALTFTQTSGAGSFVAAAPLTKTGNSFGAQLSARVVNTGGAFDLATGVVTPGTYTKITVDTYGRATTGATATPADIGAQTASSELTGVAALAATGMVARTAAGTYAARTITGSARIDVSNGNGVSGNPTIDLPAGVIASPGTYTSVTVDTYGRVTAGTGGAGAVSNLVTTLTNNHGSTIVIGRLVYIDTGDNVKLANANAAGTRHVVGMVQDTSVAQSASGTIAFMGLMTATTGQWDVVTGQAGGLTVGATYFLSNVTAGAMTTTAPTTGYLVRVGRALSTTKFLLDPQQAITL
jgi:hypothetical protein